MLDDKHLRAQQQIELYQAYILKAFNKKLMQRTFKERDFVLTVKKPMVMIYKTKGKFEPKWEGSFDVETVY